MANEVTIPKNEVINKNIDMLIGDEFWNLLIRESIGGNAGEMHAGVNAFYNTIGELTEFSNYQPKKDGKKRVTFRVDMGYLIDTRKWYEKIFSSKNDKWTIAQTYFEDKNENSDVKQVIESAVSYVNSLSNKKREAGRK